MKVTEAIGEEEEVLYYYIRTDIGSSVGSTFPNKTPIDGDEEVTLEDAKKTATLWAASRDLLEALEEMILEFRSPEYDLICDHSVGICSCTPLNIIEKAKSAIKKAKGL